MEQNVDVLLNEKSVGSAHISREGLYYRIRCRCYFTENTCFRIYMNCSDRTFDLGVCVPNGDCFVINKTIPIKLIGEGTMSFVAKRNRSVKQGIQVKENSPYISLSKLQNSRIAFIEGEMRIIDQSEGQPGSGQNP